MRAWRGSGAARQQVFTPAPPALPQALPPAEQWSELVGNTYKCDGMYLKEPPKPSTGAQGGCVANARWAVRLPTAGLTYLPVPTGAPSPTSSVCATGCVEMPGYRFYRGKTINCARYPGKFCVLGSAPPPLADQIAACNADQFCVALSTDGQLKVRRWLFWSGMGSMRCTKICSIALGQPGTRASPSPQPDPLPTSLFLQALLPPVSSWDDFPNAAPCDGLFLKIPRAGLGPYCGTAQNNTAFNGGDMQCAEQEDGKCRFPVSSVAGCCDKCHTTAGCAAFTLMWDDSLHTTGICMLKQAGANYTVAPAPDQVSAVMTPAAGALPTGAGTARVLATAGLAAAQTCLQCMAQAVPACRRTPHAQ